LNIWAQEFREFFKVTARNVSGLQIFLRMTMPNAVVKNIEDDSSTGGSINLTLRQE
jgi:hypothetical protein